ncbi:uncharacterized protein si:ch211-102c2.8 isoform X2 [Oryzias melastigma]|uniref:uncharacterized protein si:ch211-102c2.8 isoform X2 n=1 Tax=Oryzias melastigma TaxID=30732 RepID=UPI000CF7BE43|nr:uncharacterized protein si:ch211-102c2.8 isoform X2 [Oryzias melastigma]
MESPNEDGEIASNLLYPDVSWNFSLDPLLFKVDICDLLLNAIDEQLDKLQIQHPKKDAVSSKKSWNNQDNLRSKSLSKDKNVEQPALNETPTSCFDLMHSSVMEEKSGKCGFWDPDSHMETLIGEKINKEESEREQTLWRLKSLLGDVDDEEKILGDTGPPTESICTEEFVSRFKDEIVDLTLPDARQQHRNYEKSSQLGLRKSHRCDCVDMMQVRDEKESRSTQNPGDGNTGRRSVIKSVPDLDDHRNDQWSADSSTQTRNKPNSTLEKSRFYQHFQNRSPADQAALRGRKEYWRCQPQQLQKQRDSESSKPLGDFEYLTESHHCKQIWKDGSCINQSPRTPLQADQDATLAAEESAGVRALQEELEKHERCEEELQQQLEAECQRLLLFLEQSGVKQEAGGPPQRNVVVLCSFTVTGALVRLRTLGEQLRLFVGRLQQELDSQKQVCEELKKETELRIQRQQQCIEKEQALTSLRECLIKEHIEELCSLTQEDRGGPEWEAEVMSLHRRLQAKDQQLRHIQRNMDQWKEQTATRLACKFEEALKDELERCRKSLILGRKASNTQVVGSGEEILGLKELQTDVCSSCLHALDSSSSIFIPSDFASSKLLQRRVK